MLKDNTASSKNTTNKTIINLVNINKYYGKKHVLKDINIKINQGDRISIIGGNGSGKSTLAEIISSVRKPSSGTMQIDKKSNVGIQFQESVYPIGITVKALIRFYLDELGKNLSRDRIDQLTKVFRLKSLLKKQVVYLSGGQQQRLNIFLAVIQNPDILILDELSTGLDIKIKTDLEQVIVQYLKDNPHVTLILITHTISEIQQLTNRVIVLNWGKITYDLSTKAIIDKYKTMDSFVETLFADMYKKDNLDKSMAEE